MFVKDLLLPRLGDSLHMSVWTVKSDLTFRLDGDWVDEISARRKLIDVAPRPRFVTLVLAMMFEKSLNEWKFQFL